MGREERANKQAQVGKFNVSIAIQYTDGKSETIEAKSWNHIGAYLALDLYDDRLKVVCLSSVKHFVITGRDETLT